MTGAASGGRRFFERRRRVWRWLTAAWALAALASVVVCARAWSADDGLVSVTATIVDVDVRTVRFTSVGGETYLVPLDELPEDADSGDAVSVVYPPGRPREARRPDEVALVAGIAAWFLAGAAVSGILRLRWFGRVLAADAAIGRARGGAGSSAGSGLRTGLVVVGPTGADDEGEPRTRAHVWFDHRGPRVAPVGGPDGGAPDRVPDLALNGLPADTAGAYRAVVLGPAPIVRTVAVWLDGALQPADVRSGRVS